ncbi:MAG: type II secretion system protein [Candidatus Levybacteria bacterium]|nr:type II secretion system protein [Candidatus Levybacteria bacterium]
MKNLFRKATDFKGFTLIELLIVIAILGVLAAGILVAIDPIDKINQANDAKVQNDVSGAGRASEAYATVHNGFYPATLQDLVDAGELKRLPQAPSGYDAYSVVNMTGTPPVNAGSCTAGSECTGIIVSGRLKSKKYAVPDTTYWQYQSPSGKSCAVRTYTGNGCG